MALKVNGQNVVLSNAEIVTDRLPVVAAISNGTYGSATDSAVANVNNRGLVQNITNSEISKTSINFEASSNNLSSMVVYVSTDSPSGGQDGDVWYQVYS